MIQSKLIGDRLGPQSRRRSQCRMGDRARAVRAGTVRWQSCGSCAVLIDDRNYLSADAFMCAFFFVADRVMVQRAIRWRIPWTSFFFLFFFRCCIELYFAVFGYRLNFWLDYKLRTLHAGTFLIYQIYIIWFFFATELGEMQTNWPNVYWYVVSRHQKCWFSVFSLGGTEPRSLWPYRNDGAARRTRRVSFFYFFCCTERIDMFYFYLLLFDMR